MRQVPKYLHRDYSFFGITATRSEWLRQVKSGGIMSIDIEAIINARIVESVREITEAEEKCIVRAILLAGYEPIADPDAEWTKHISMSYEGAGRKIISVDDKPSWRIISEPVNKDPGNKSTELIVSYETRMEPVLS